MSLKPFKKNLFKLHRWIGVGLAPLFLLILLSGAVLAFKPILQESPAATDAKATASELIDFLQRLGPLGQTVDSLRVDGTGQVSVGSRDPAVQGRFDLASATRLDSGTEAEDAEPFDLFEFAEHLHKDLLVGADLPVQIASYAMLLLVVSAPLLSWPRLRNNLMGWHRGVGWLLLPVVLMLPLSGVLMSLHVGTPELPRMSQPGTELTLEQGLRNALQAESLAGVNNVRRFRGGSVLLGIQQEEGERRLMVTDQSVVPLNPQDNLVKTLHEGTWAGPWSGFLNLLGATALSLLGTTGFVSWWRRRRKVRQTRLRQQTAESIV